MRDGEGVIILGGGITALALAYHAQIPVTIYEGSDRPGGLCRTLKVGGYLLDLGVHTLFTSVPYVADLYRGLLNGRLNGENSVARIYYRGDYVDFPFQANLWQVPAADRDSFLRDLRRERQNPRVRRTYEDWLVASFGQAMAEGFMLPYNLKKYGTDLKTLDAAPFASKNPVPPLEEIEAGARAPSTKTYGHNPRWQYPREGGFQTLVDAFVKRIGGRASLECCRRAIRLLPRLKEIVFSDGTRVRYNLLISTLPLDQLVAMTQDLSPEISRAAKVLTKNEVRIFSFGVSGEPETLFHWAYYAQAHIPFIRLSMPSLFARDVAPAGHHLIQAEVTDPGTGIEDVEDALVEVRAIRSRERITFRHVIPIPYAYPHQALGTDTVVQTILSALQTLGIHSLGRFGTWSYLDADRCILQGRDFAQAFLQA